MEHSASETSCKDKCQQSPLTMRPCASASDTDLPVRANTALSTEHEFVPCVSDSQQAACTGGNLHGSQEMAISDAEEAGAMDPEDETALRTIAFAEADKTPNGSQDSNGKLEAGSALQTQVQQLQAVLGDAVAGDVAQKLIR